MSFFRRWLLITVLGFSGGIIFLLPFLFEVFYTPLGSALGLNHTKLGSPIRARMFGKQSADAGQRSLRTFVLKVKCQEWLSPRMWIQRRS